jgi:hypothetical protein
MNKNELQTSTIKKSMKLKSISLIKAAALILGATLSASLPARAYQMYMDLGQFPTDTLNFPTWSSTLNLCDGALCLAAPFVDPLVDPQTRAMSWGQRQTLVNQFGTLPKILETNWQRYSAPMNLGNTEVNIMQDNWGCTFNFSFMWDESQYGSTLTTGQLNILNQGPNPYPRPIILNSRGWNSEKMAAIKASINHIKVAGVMIEGQPYHFINNLNSRMEEAKWILNNTTKKLYILVPAAHDYNTNGSHLEDIQRMVTHFKQNMAPQINTDRVVIIPAAYDTAKTLIPFLPEANANNAPVNNFMGGALYIGRHK